MSLGRDLSTIRKEKNLSLEEVFSATKIPVHTLESIEKGTFWEHSSNNKTYLRSFVRSYAKALKIPDDIIIISLEKTDDGTYDRDLIKMLHPDTKTESFSVQKEKVVVKEDSESENETPIVASGKETTEASPKANTEKEQPKDATQARSPKNAPTVSTVDWANMSKKVYTSPSGSKLWVVLLVFVLFASLVGAAYYYGDDILALFESDYEPIEEMIGTQDDANTANDADLTGSDNLINVDPASGNQIPANTSPAVMNQADFGDTITVTVYAAFDKLEPVRVTSDINWRTNPFWMNRGEAYYFDFNDTLLVRGQYNRFLLLFNGHVIENPRQNNFSQEYNSIMLTRSALMTSPYLETPPEQFPLSVGEPDSIIYKITY